MKRSQQYQFHCQSWIFMAHSCKASNALYMTADWKKEKFLNRAGNCQKNVLDYEEWSVAGSRPSGQLQRRPNVQTLNAGDTIFTAGRPQVLPTGNVGDQYAAFHRIRSLQSPQCTIYTDANRAHNVVVWSTGCRRLMTYCLHIRLETFNQTVMS